MSTSIKYIEGKKLDVPGIGDSCSLHLNRFWGGLKFNGRALQLTINNNRDGYICLTQEQTIELARTLLNAFNDDIYPSE